MCISVERGGDEMKREKMFVRMNPVYDLHNAMSRYAHFTAIANSTQISFRNYALVLLDYYNRPVNSKKLSSYHTRYGNEFVILIPEGLSFEEMTEVYTVFLKQIHASDLVSYCFYNKKKNGHYLHIYVYEREFYPEGLSVKKYAKRTSYRNVLTKKLCSASDPNSELMYQKGDCIGEETVYFSEKKRRIFSGRGHELSNLLQVLKDIISATIQSFGSSFPVGYFITKYSFKDVKGSYLHRNTYLWNNAFQMIDNELNKLITAGLYCDIDTEAEVNQLCAKYQKFKDREKCRYKKKHKISINVRSEYKNIESYVDLFLRKFKEDLIKAYKRCFGEIDTSFA